MSATVSINTLREVFFDKRTVLTKLSSEPFGTRALLRLSFTNPAIPTVPADICNAIEFKINHFSFKISPLGMFGYIPDSQFLPAKPFLHLHTFPFLHLPPLRHPPLHTGAANKVKR